MKKNLERRQEAMRRRHATRARRGRPRRADVDTVDGDRLTVAKRRLFAAALLRRGWGTDRVRDALVRAFGFECTADAIERWVERGMEL